jgi:hypothetical protein
MDHRHESSAPNCHPVRATPAGAMIARPNSPALSPTAAARRLGTIELVGSSAVFHADSYPEHSTTRPSALQPQANGASPAKTQRPQNKLIPNLAFLAPWREENRSQSSNNKCVHLRGTTLVLFQFHRRQQRNHANRQRKHIRHIHRSDKDLCIPRIRRRPRNP